MKDNIEDLQTIDSSSDFEKEPPSPKKSPTPKKPEIKTGTDKEALKKETVSVKKSVCTIFFVLYTHFMLLLA